MSAILGVDVGATTIAAGLVTPDGAVLYTVQQATHAAGPGTAVKTLLALVEELTREAERRRLTIDGVGVGVPGVIDPARGVMLAPPGNGVPELGDVRLAEEIHRVTGLSAYVDNDGNALALAEWTFGVGRGTRSLVLFALGTDVGGGIIVDGELVRGARGYAGEFHSLPVASGGECCYCGVRGCLGSFVGGRAIAAEARRQLAAGAPSSAVRLAGGDADAVSAVHVFEAAVAGDPMAREIVDGICATLATGIGAVVSTLDPDVVVVTGGVAQSLVPLADEIRGLASARALWPAIAHTRIEVIASDKRLTVRGGAALVLYHRTRASRDGKG